MMNSPLWWLAIGAAALIGAAFGALAARAWLGRRHAAATKQAVEAARHDSTATMERLRAAYTSVRLDQEHQRAALPRKLAAAALEHRATIARLEEELRVAYVEVDRLRRPLFGGLRPAAPDPDEPDHGFAPTQTFDDPA